MTALGRGVRHRVPPRPDQPHRAYISRILTIADQLSGYATYRWPFARLTVPPAPMAATRSAAQPGQHRLECVSHAASAQEHGVEAERTADRWGITAVLRGLDVVDDPVQAFRISWPGATAVLGTVAAILMARSQGPDGEKFSDAYHRLTGFITALVQEVARQWQICEVAAIGKCAAILLAAVTQWLLWEWGLEDPRDGGMGRLLSDDLINGSSGAKAAIDSLPLIIPCTGQHGPAGPTITLR